MRLLAKDIALPVTFGLTVLVAGCTLSSPYVRYPGEKAGFCGAVGCSIDEALGYSRSVRAAYRDVLDQYARLRSNSGAATIALGAAALGAAIGDANKDVFTALGLVGATQYGYAAWYGNAPREALFAQTIQALVCAEGATAKLRFPPSAEQASETLRAQAAIVSAEVDRSAGTLSAAIGELNVYLVAKAATASQLPANTKRRKAADADLAAIKQLLGPLIQTSGDVVAKVPAAQDALNNALAALMARERAADAAGYALVSAVDRIVAATDVEAQKTVPDPAAAFSVVTGLGGVAGKFIPSTDAVTALKTAAGAFKMQAQGAANFQARLQGELQPMLDRLSTAQSGLAAAVLRLVSLARVISDLAAPPSPDAMAAVDKCTIAGVGTLSAVPSGVEITAGKSASVSVDLQGGKTPYRVEFSGTPPTGIDLSQPGFNDSRFVVIGKTESAAGDANIKVTDGSGRMLEVTLTVK